MSARYTPVGWGRTKYVYDAVALAGIGLYLVLYLRLGPALQDVTLPPDEQTAAMRAFGSCAFILLSVVLAIGPLARLDRRFLPLLYNRRHLGVMTCMVAAGHAGQVLGWYFAYSPTPPLVALLGADTSFGQLQGFPFIPFGLAAFVILFALAATSHDFWLAFLGPALWKGLHMVIYAAYALVVAHVALGALQASVNPLPAMLVTASALALTALHLAAAARARHADRDVAQPWAEWPWLVAGRLEDILPDHGLVVQVPDGEAVAIFRHAGALSAVSNLCAHQNGPLGEGRVLDGCITCPWHGFQYRLEDGCAPAPFTEKLATYRLRLDGHTILLDPRPNPPGTRVAPLLIGAPA
jgi:DMSO/TMAO reductase YedYZ heme-binding membrane subunit/nitrite reductase/ring-hydroxylating ferredoxin subunit